MSNIKLSVDDFLEEEKIQTADLSAIIEVDEQNSNNVIIALWSNTNCHCSSSLSIAKEHIDAVEKTDKTVFCCGKNHTVVKVFFKKDASINLEDLWKQLAEKENHFHNEGSNLIAPSIWDNNYDTVFLNSNFCKPAEIERRYCPGGSPRGTQTGFESYRYVQIYRDIRTGKKCGEIASPCYKGYNGGGGIA